MRCTIEVGRKERRQRLKEYAKTEQLGSKTGRVGGGREENRNEGRGEVSRDGWRINRRKQ